jgi:hypothetical protein
LARYIIRASFSQEKSTYILEDSKVIYKSKDGKQRKIFDALEWFAAMCLDNNIEGSDDFCLIRQDEKVSYIKVTFTK